MQGKPARQEESAAAVLAGQEQHRGDLQLPGLPAPALRHPLRGLGLQRRRHLRLRLAAQEQELLEEGAEVRVEDLPDLLRQHAHHHLQAGARAGVQAALQEPVVLRQVPRPHHAPPSRPHHAPAPPPAGAADPAPRPWSSRAPAPGRVHRAARRAQQAGPRRVCHRRAAQQEGSPVTAARSCCRPLLVNYVKHPECFRQDAGAGLQPGQVIERQIFD